MAAQSRIHASILWIPIPPVDLSAVSTSIPGIPTMPGSPTPDTAREHRRNPTMFSTSPTTRSQGRPFGPASRAVWETSRSRRRFVTMLPATFMQRMTSASFVCREATPCGRQRRGDFLRPKFRPCPFQPQHEYSTLPPMGAEPTCCHFLRTREVPNPRTGITEAAFGQPLCLSATVNASPMAEDDL